MRVIETTAHVGPDGMLRLEVPIEQRDQDVRVAVVVESARTQPPMRQGVEDAWASVRGPLEAAGMRVPPPQSENAGPVNPVKLPGPTASQMLVADGLIQ